MNLGGIMGEIEIKNIDEKSYHVLKLGELLACGKSTVFGLGKIEICPIQSYKGGESE
jgi:CRISPR/Cas system endoribonuclease Cas6 (RAMP superfamily)